MAKITYEVVEHDEGFAYKVGDVFSERFPTHALALKAAEQAAERQKLAGTDEAIQYQDREGHWHEELASGGSRPDTDVVDEVDDASDKDGGTQRQ
jgi:hypothetical protein